MKHTDTLYTAFTGGAVAGIAYLFGGLDNLVLALAIIMVIDFATGVSASATANAKEKTNSKRAIKGVAKKAAMLSLVILANQLDIIAGSDEAHFMRNAMIFFLIGTEGISILENMERLGVPFPKFIKERFEQMQDDFQNKKDDQQ